MEKKCQAGLEYIMTYGWALIFIATIVGALAFITSPPLNEQDFQISGQGEFKFAGGKIIGNQMLLTLENNAGRIEITGFKETGYSECTLNEKQPEGQAIENSQDMRIQCLTLEGEQKLEIAYTSQAAVEKTLEIIRLPP